MADDFKYDVFLSHSARDKAILRDVADRLRGDGLRVRFDEWETPPEIPLAHRMGEGSGVRAAKIEAELEHSYGLVLCMSAQAFPSINWRPENCDRCWRPNAVMVGFCKCKQDPRHVDGTFRA